MSAPPKIRVVLVDDVPELRLVVRLTLEDDPGIEVVGEASNGRDGVRVVQETRPDLVLLDLSMPDMDGLEAIPLMREQAPMARVVVLSRRSTRAPPATSTRPRVWRRFRRSCTRWRSSSRHSQTSASA